MNAGVLVESKPFVRFTLGFGLYGIRVLIMNEFDAEEREILEAFEAGKLKRVPDADEQIARHRIAAEATFKKDSREEKDYEFEAN